jgi:hypothetical protein
MSNKLRNILLSSLFLVGGLYKIEPSTAATLTRDNQKGINTIALSICYSEGNCDISSSGEILFTKHYWGHLDPGNGVHNNATCSNQKGLPLEQANIDCHNYIAGTVSLLKNIFSLSSLSNLSPKEKLEITTVVADLRVQSISASEDFPRDLECAIYENPNDSLFSQLVKARVKSYYKREYNSNQSCDNYTRLDAPGLDNNFNKVYQDSLRRVQAIYNALNSMSQNPSSLEKWINEDTLSLSKVNNKTKKALLEILDIILYVDLKPDIVQDPNLNPPTIEVQTVETDLFVQPIVHSTPVVKIEVPPLTEGQEPTSIMLEIDPLSPNDREFIGQTQNLAL